MGFYYPDKPWTVAVDFDGTIAYNPEGTFLEAPVLRYDFLLFFRKVRALLGDVQWVIFTARDVSQYTAIYKAFSNFFSQYGDSLSFDERNCLSRLGYSVTSIKPIADFYIDDLVVGCPLVNIPETPYKVVDFIKVYKMIRARYQEFERNRKDGRK